VVNRDEAKGKMRERLLPVVRTFDYPPPEVNDGGGREGTAIGIRVKYAQRDHYGSILGNEGSLMVESISVHDAV
jgi:hypothetical protein